VTGSNSGMDKGQEKPGQTLQATVLVHEAYVRLVDVNKVQHWNSRGHFYAAAAEAMRRILVENARRKKALRRGGLNGLGNCAVRCAWNARPVPLIPGPHQRERAPVEGMLPSL